MYEMSRNMSGDQLRSGLPRQQDQYTSNTRSGETSRSKQDTGNARRSLTDAVGGNIYQVTSTPDIKHSEEAIDIEQALTMAYRKEQSIAVVWSREEYYGKVGFFTAGIPHLGEHTSDRNQKNILLFPAGAEGMVSSPQVLNKQFEQFPFWGKIVSQPKKYVSPETKKQDTPRRSLADFFNMYQGPGIVVVNGNPAPPEVRRNLEEKAYQKGMQKAQKEALANQNDAVKTEAEMIGRELAELTKALDKGYWPSINYLVGAKTPEELRVLADLVALYTDAGEAPLIMEPVLRTEPYSFSEALEDPHVIQANTEVLARLAAPPQQEIPGVGRRPMNSFALNTVENTSGDTRQVRVGSKVDRFWRPLPPQEVTVSYQDLLEGLIVFGPPGSGKTGALTQIMEGILQADNNVNLIIITTTKSPEMERLANLTSKSFVRLPVGSSKESLLGLNLFRPLYPHLLEMHMNLMHSALTADYYGSDQEKRMWRDYINYGFQGDPANGIAGVYQQLGLDPVTGERLPEFLANPPYPDFPRFRGTLLEEVKALEYAKLLSSMEAFVNEGVSRYTHDVLGRFLEGVVPLDIGKLFQHHTIIELDDIGEPQDQSFVMNLFLIYMFEYLQENARKRGTADAQPLDFLLVLDELHNMFPEGSAEQDKARERKFRLLREMRWYGGGYAAAAQIPRKLPQDLTTLPGTKGLFRTGNADDIELVLRGFGLKGSEEHYRIITSLKRGQALWYNSNMIYGPVIAQTDNPDDRPQGTNRVKSPDILAESSGWIGYHGKEFAERLPTGKERQRARDVLYHTQEGLVIESLADVLLMATLMGVGEQVRLREDIIKHIFEQVHNSYGEYIDSSRTINGIPVDTRRIIGETIVQAVNTALKPRVLGILKNLPDAQKRPRKDYEPLEEIKDHLTTIIYDQIFHENNDKSSKRKENYAFPQLRDTGIHRMLFMKDYVAEMKDLAAKMPELDLERVFGPKYKGKTAKQEYERLQMEQRKRGNDKQMDATDDLILKIILAPLSDEDKLQSPQRAKYNLRIEALTEMSLKETQEMPDVWMEQFIRSLENFQMDEITQDVLITSVERMVKKYRKQIQEETIRTEFEKSQQADRRTAAALEGQISKLQQLNDTLNKFFAFLRKEDETEYD